MQSPGTTGSASRGFTLVELLVALALGIMLSLGIANIYLESRRNYSQDEEVARLQENARYALKLLKRDLTMAGFVAGLPDASIVPVGTVTDDCVDSGEWALRLTGDVFELVNDADRGTTPTTLNTTELTCVDESTLVDETDIIAIKRSADRPTLRDGSLTITGDEKTNQWYLRSFDNHAELSWAYVIAPGFNSDDEKLDSNVDYWEFYSRIYFIRDHSRTAGDDIPTLCMTHLSADKMSTDCLVEGIEDMQIEVGIDSNDDSVPDRFLANPTAAQIANAVVIRVYLLVRSVNPITGYTNDKSYQLGSKAIGAKNDGFVRRVFSTTVQMRNAKLPNA